MVKIGAFRLINWTLEQTARSVMVKNDGVKFIHRREEVDEKVVCDLIIKWSMLNHQVIDHWVSESKFSGTVSADCRSCARKDSIYVTTLLGCSMDKSKDCKIARAIPKKWNTQNRKLSRREYAEWFLAEGSQKRRKVSRQFDINIWTGRSQGKSPTRERAVRVMHGRSLAISPAIWRRSIDNRKNTMFHDGIVWVISRRTNYFHLGQRLHSLNSRLASSLPCVQKFATILSFWNQREIQVHLQSSSWESS